MGQILVDTVVYGSEIAIIAVGIALAFSILKFANFAHIQYAIMGGYATYTVETLFAPGLVVATIAGCLFTGLVAVAVDRLVFSRLRGSAPEVRMIVSWGGALVIRAAVATVYGGEARFFEVRIEPVDLAGLYVTSLDVIVVAITVAAMISLRLLMFRTRLGTALRAISSNPELAATRGIPIERMVMLMWFLAGAYAGLGGTLFALQTRLQPSMDLAILLPVFAATTIGGLGSVFGAVVGAFVLALAQNALIQIDFGTLLSLDRPWRVPSQFRDVIAVAAFILVLLLRPRRAAAWRA
jgi:branched-subunit amino acid ABC-type transport system permease component